MAGRSGGSAAAPLLTPRHTGDALKIGIVGTGDVSASHAQAIHDQPDMVLVAAADPERLRCEEWAADGDKGRGCVAYGSLDEMATREKLDGVVVAVPDEFHADVAVKAMTEYGLPTLGEKPPGKKVADADEIAKASEDTHVPYLLGLVYIHAMNLIRPFATEEILGHRYLSIADWMRRRGLVTWRSGPYDPWPDLGVHLIGVLSYLHGWPVPTWASARKSGFVGEEALINELFDEGGQPLDPRLFEGVDTCAVTFDFHQPDFRWDVHTAFLGNFERGEAIQVASYGSRGGLVVPFVAGKRKPEDYPPRLSREELGMLGTTLLDRPVGPDMPQTFANQMAHFGRVIRREIPPVAGPREGQLIQRMIAMVDLSAEREGWPVKYDEV